MASVTDILNIVDPSLVTKGIKGHSAPNTAVKESVVKELFEKFPPQLIGEIPEKTKGSRILVRLAVLQSGLQVTSKEKGTSKVVPMVAQRRLTAEEKEAGLTVKPYNYHSNALDYLKVVAMLCEDGVPAETVRAFLEFAPEGTPKFFDRVPEAAREKLVEFTLEHMPQVVTAPNKKQGKESEPSPIAVSREWLREFWLGEAQTSSEASAAKAASKAKSRSRKAS